MRTGRFTSPGPWTGLLAVCMACGALSTATAAEKAAKYALLVGVTKYEHSRMNDAPLKFPEADAKSVGELLRASGYTVRLLLGKAATREAILRELKLLARQGAHDGAVVVGLFGHGVQYGDDAFFGPFDTGIRQSTDAAGQVILNSRGQVRFEPDSRTMVNMEAILIALRACGAGNRVLLADCCRNDPAAARGRAFGSSLKMANLRSGTAALFACSAGERAFEHDDWQHGAFTKALLDHAAHLAARGNVLAGSLSERIHRSVADMVKARTKGRFSQTVNPLVNGIVDLKLVAATRRPATPQPPPFRPRPVSRKPAETVASIRGMQLKLIPAGSFQMGSGSTSKELARRFSARAEYFASEFPRHHVKITRPFYMGVHEVTQGQWQDVMGTAPWRNKELVQAHENNPAVYVSWTDACEFCQKLSLRDGATYRLPTEAEWEYACRAGSSTLYSFGDDQQQLDRHAWFRRNADDAGKAFAHPVGVRQPNDWGLFDMHGNVWEWCQDRFDEKYYRQFATRVAVDPQGPFGRSSGRVYRGGCWFGSPQGCRASNRAGDSPGLRFNYLGFRIVREVPNTAPDFVRRNTEPGSTGR